MDQRDHSNENPQSSINAQNKNGDLSQNNSVIEQSLSKLSSTSVMNNKSFGLSTERKLFDEPSNLSPMNNGSGSILFGTSTDNHEKDLMPNIPKQQTTADLNENPLYPPIQSDSFIDAVKSAFNKNNESSETKNESLVNPPIPTPPSFTTFSSLGVQSALNSNKESGRVVEKPNPFSSFKTFNQTSPISTGLFSNYGNTSNQGSGLFSMNQSSISTQNESKPFSFSFNTQSNQQSNVKKDSSPTTSLNSNQRPIFSAINPTNTPPTFSDINLQNTTTSTKPAEPLKSDALGGTVSGSALGSLASITSGLKSNSNRPVASTDSTALGKLSSLCGPLTSNESSNLVGAKPPSFTFEPSMSSKVPESLPKLPMHTPEKTESVLGLRDPIPNGPFILPTNQYFGATTNKPIIDNLSEFNYQLPDHLSQPNSPYIKNYIIPKLGSVDEITKKLNAAHIENKSQLDTLDSLSSNIIDLVQNKNMYYGSGQFKDMHLKPELIQGLFEMGYRIPSRIQEATLPIIVNQKRNLVAQSQNGTGKTGAFVLALLSNLDPLTNHPEAVVLAPTYELASQTKSVIDKMARYMSGMSTILGIKGNRLAPGTKITDKIVIGTPGTIADWMTKFKFFDSRLIKMFVLDEADVMISQTGHLSMCSRIKSSLPKNCQSLLFSATYPASVCSFANFSVPNATVIRVKSSELTLESVKQYYTYVANQNEQFDFAWNLFTTICISQCIIFCDTRSAAKNLASKFISCGFKTSVISGEQPVEERAAVIERLRRGKDKVLIATNVVARGIDISTTSLIINFDIPIEYNNNRQSTAAVPNFETYLHRVGRAGRFGVKGICVTVAKSMQDIDMLGQIQAYYNHEIKPIHPWDAEELQKLDPIKYAMEADNN